ncbi:MAG: metallophosphoesterase [Gemmatimonadota bacterium]
MLTVVVGDVHGCAGELRELLDRVGFHPASHRLLLTGDAFSRGPDPIGVWHLIRATGAAMVLGNHDDRLLRQLRAARAGDQVELRRPHHRRTYELLQPLAAELLPWLESLPLYLRQEEAPPGGLLLVHAGIDPVRGLTGTTREQLLSLRTWPPAGSLEGPRWYDHLGPQDGCIAFGHDAPGGLVVRRRPDGGRPWLVGLDSGCVYGGSLSAYVIEADRILQVPSRQPALYP